MRTKLTCPCGATVHGVDEDDLVTLTLEHLAEIHPGRVYDRETILFIAE